MSDLYIQVRRGDQWRNAALRLTASGLITALRPTAQPWKEIVVNDEVVGTLCQTDRSDPTMRWKWTAMGMWSFARTEQEAVEQIKARAVRWVAEKKACEADERAREAEIAALPHPLRLIRINLDAAKTRLEIALARNVRRDDEVQRCLREVVDLEIEYLASERAMVA